MLSCIQEEKHIEGLKNYRGLNKFKRACLNMSLVMIHGFVIRRGHHATIFIVVCQSVSPASRCI